MTTLQAIPSLLLTLLCATAQASDFMAADDGIILVQDGVVDRLVSNVERAEALVVSSTGELWYHDRAREKLVHVGVDGRRTDLRDEADIDALALDETHAKLYWASNDDNAIRRCDLDGSNVETLASDQSAVALAIDVPQGKLYFVEDAFDGLRRMDLDGTNPELIVAAQGNLWRRGVDLDPTTDRVWWVQSGTLHSAELDGSNPSQFRDPNGSQLADVAIDAAAGKLYWTDIGGAPPYAIRRANLDGTDIEEIATTTSAPYSIDVVDDAVYWTSWSGYVTRAGLDGSNPEDLVSPTRVGAGLVADADAGMVWWTDFEGSIWRMPVDTRQPERIIADAQSPGSLTADLDAGLLYWTSSAGIQRANLDGTNVTQVGVGTGTEISVAIDPSIDRLFTSARTSIEAQNVDGSDPSTVVSGLVLSFSVAVDPIDAQVWWTDLFAGTVSRAGYDGSNVTAIHTGASGALAIAVDAAAGKVYWSDDQGVNASDLDGSNAEVLYAGDAPAAIAPYAAPSFEMTQSDIVGGGTMTFDITGAVPGARVFFLASGSIDPTQALCHPVATDVCTDLQSPTVLGSRVADLDGEAQLTVAVPAVPSGFTVYTEAVYIDGSSGGSTGTYTQQAL